MNPSPERELKSVEYVEHDMLLTLACKTLRSLPPYPAGVLPARWGNACDVVSEQLAWAFRSAEVSR